MSSVLSPAEAPCILNGIKEWRLNLENVTFCIHENQPWVFAQFIDFSSYEWTDCVCCVNDIMCRGSGPSSAKQMQSSGTFFEYDGGRQTWAISGQTRRVPTVRFRCKIANKMIFLCKANLSFHQLSLSQSTADETRPWGGLHFLLPDAGFGWWRAFNMKLMPAWVWIFFVQLTLYYARYS